MRKCLLISSLLFVTLQLSHAVGGFSLGSPDVYGWGSEEYGTGSYLGVDITDITSDRLAALKLKEEQGVEVTIVDQDAPAGKAGLKEHDVILTMNGNAIESGAQLRRMIRETPPGRVVSLGISRDGQPLTIKVQLADRKKALAYPSPKDMQVEIPPMPPMPDIDVPVSIIVVHSSMRSGLMVESLTSQLGDFFGVKNGHGVLVRSVEKGSRADKAGFRAGDVIVRVNEQPVSDSSDFVHALRSRNGTVKFGIIRDKKELTLTMTLPERKSTGELFNEESLDLPDLDAENRVDLSEVKSELARVQPQMELAMQQARRAMEAARSELCREQQRLELQHQKAFRGQQQEMRERAEEMRDQAREQQRQLREQQKKRQEQIRHELRGDWIEI